MTNVIISITIIAYLLLVLGVGAFYSRKTKNVDDFYLGGRKLGPIVTAMSAEASDMSSWLLMGLPGVAYLTGVADAAWTAIGLAIGTYVNWLIVAKRIRRYTYVAGNSITIPEFFSKRYRDDKNILMFIAAVVIVIFFVPYTASGFAACGKLFNSLFDVDYFTAMVISAIVIVLYTTLGGFLAASITDFIQSIVMTLALIMILVFGIYSAGGIDSVAENAREMVGYLSFTNVHNPVTNEATSYGFITIISTLAWGLGYFGMPHILLRFMAIDNENKLKLSRRVASVWVVISLAVAVFIGIIGSAITEAGNIPALSGSASETLIVEIATLLSTYGPLAAILTGIVLAGILASTMSTADSQLLAASSSVSENIAKDVFKVNISKKAQMILARLSVLVIAVIAVILASDPDSSVFNIVSFAWAGFGAAFGPVVLFALFWKRSNKWGALAGMISGGAMVFIWKYCVRTLGGIWDIYELLPAFIVASIAIVVVSLLTEKPSDDIINEFERVASGESLEQAE
jgi:sodium/proline symporter